MKGTIPIILFICTNALPLQAATMMEVSNSESGDSRVWISEQYAYIDVIKNNQSVHGKDALPGEMIIDIKNKKLYAIDHKAKALVEISDFSMPEQARPAPQEVKITFTNQGAGHSVAGFATHQYQVSANGMKCYNALFSKEVLKNKEIVAFYTAMVGSAPQQASYANACEAADAQMDRIPVDKYGIALKVMDLNGNALYEVKKIQEDVIAPAKYLQLPPGYKIKSMAEMLKQMQTQPSAPPSIQ